LVFFKKFFTFPIYDYVSFAMFDPATATLAATPVRAYGIEDVSRPLGAVLLGRSLKAFDRVLAIAGVDPTGRCHQRVSLADIEALAGRVISVDAYLNAIHHPRFTSPTGSRSIQSRREVVLLNDSAPISAPSYGTSPRNLA
jgi:hypothetical protein